MPLYWQQRANFRRPHRQLPSTRLGLFFASPAAPSTSPNRSGCMGAAALQPFTSFFQTLATWYSPYVRHPACLPLLVHDLGQAGAELPSF